MSLAIVWFRRDLRLADQPALAAAARHHDRILPLYVHAPDEEGDWAPGAASRWWLHHALRAFDASLGRHHGRLHIRTGRSLDALLDLVRETGAEAVYWNRLYEPAAIERDTEVKRVLRERGLHVASFDAALWRSPWQVLTQKQEPYRVFTPFWRNLRAQLGEETPLPVPTPLRLCGEIAGGTGIDALGLLPGLDWAEGFGQHWTPGEQGALETLERFVDDALGGYAEQRDRPDRIGTSRLSPHLHFGEISPRTILGRLRAVADDPRRRERVDAEPFLRELGWREFAHHLLFHFPRTTDHNLDTRFDRFEWSGTQADLGRWRRGRTGIPIVDAGMRELWSSGWMHNRVRMIVASLLTKNLRHHWLQGARWFWDTLVDADLANNTLGWQWVAGCGADAAPYFRIFNPVTQSQRFDPDGTYIRCWVPELAGLSAKTVHAPWESGATPHDYPAPIVDLKRSRQAALDAYAAIKS